MRFFENILLFYNDEFAGIKAEVIRLVRKNQARLKIIDVFDNFDQYLELLPLTHRQCVDPRFRVEGEIKTLG